MSRPPWSAIGPILLAVASPAPAGDLAGTTVNAFLARGTPTFVVGTAGDDRADREIRSQAESIRDLLFPRAEVVADDAIDVARGPDAWPAHPVLYGDAATHSVLARLAPAPPFRVGPGRLEIGGRTFRGDEYGLIAVVPGRAAGTSWPGYPEFLVYAGTGGPGLAGINGVRHGPEPVLVVDAFGRLLVGGWRPAGEGVLAADFPRPAAERAAWRFVDRATIAAAGAPPFNVRLAFPAGRPAEADEAALIDAALRGLARASRTLQIDDPPRLTIYVHPDHAAKGAWTGDAGDGHANQAARELHVVRFDPAPGGPFEGLIAHEAAHVLAARAWGVAGSALLGEGGAVWAAGSYGGATLPAWRIRHVFTLPSPGDLLAGRPGAIPERRFHPAAGLFVQAAVGRVGLAAVRDHLYPATPARWDEACRRAGATPGELEAAYRRPPAAP